MCMLQCKENISTKKIGLFQQSPLTQKIAGFPFPFPVPNQEVVISSDVDDVWAMPDTE